MSKSAQRRHSEARALATDPVCYVCGQDTRLHKHTAHRARRDGRTGPVVTKCHQCYWASKGFDFRNELREENRTMSAKHTPGPWYAYFDARGRACPPSIFDGQLVEDDDGYRVPPGTNWIADCHMQGDRLTDMHNARLIAAAPDLLEACERLTEELASMHEHYFPGGDCDCPTTEIIAEGRAAIAKAKGGA